MSELRFHWPALAITSLAACFGGGKAKSVGPGDLGTGSTSTDSSAIVFDDGENIHLGGDVAQHPVLDGVTKPEEKPVLGTDTPGGNQAPDDRVAVGMRSKDVINKGVRERYAGFRQCYENLALAHPGLAGKLFVTFTISFEGTVTEASAKGVHPDLETCVETEVRKLKFPRHDGSGSVQVSYPFTFSP